MTKPRTAGDERLPHLVGHFDRALEQLSHARPFAKHMYQARVFELALRLLEIDCGLERLATRAAEFDAAGVFYGGDWLHPERLDPTLVRNALCGTDPFYRGLEVLNQLRMVAIARGEASHESLDAGRARAYLEQVVALNVELLFPESSEATRGADRGTAEIADGVRALFEHVVHALGGSGIVRAIVDEVERILQQRPILVHRPVAMVDTIQRGLSLMDDEALVDGLRERAETLITARSGASERAHHADDLDAYRQTLRDLAPDALLAEARAFGQAVRRTGLTSPQHAVLMRHIRDSDNSLLIAEALALDNVGRESLSAYGALVRRLIDVAIHSVTAQSLLGLAGLLERGTLFFPPVAPGLWRLVDLEIQPATAEALQRELGGDAPPPAIGLLTAGVLSVLGQPLGVGQGDNPTCQSARAISLWAQVDPGFLLEMITWAARDDEMDMHFEGALIESHNLSTSLIEQLHTELDAVSLILVPHLDRIYMEMGRRCSGRGEDHHRWVNPEFHGWWVHRGFAIAVQVSSGAVVDFAHFIRLFHAAYHAYFNGGRWMVYPQPAGIAATNAQGTFLGWHAVSIQRVALDADGIMRVYFYNPNNDGGQDWGDGVVTSTHGNGEFAGEASLPFEQFASRLYVFHYNQRELGDLDAVPSEAVDRIVDMARLSWARAFPWHDIVRG